MLFYFIYAYARPYKSTYVNIIEIVLLGYLGIFLSLIHCKFGELQALNNIQLDGTSSENDMPSISPVGILMGVVYCLPVAVLIILLGRWLLCPKVVRKLRYETSTLCMHCRSVRYSMYVVIYDMCVAFHALKSTYIYI